MSAEDREEDLLRSVALQNAHGILAARQRAEEALVRAKEELEAKSQELLEEKRVLELLIRVGRALTSKLDVQATVQALTDAAVEITRAQVGAFFFNTQDHGVDAYRLYTFSGESREAFSHFPLPRATALFGPTFRGEGVIRVEDIQADPRYGKSEPYFGMPPGHFPVRSYLAVPVISHSGIVHGGLFLGHAAVGVFTERDASVLSNIAVQAAVAIDNALLYEASEEARTQLEVMNDTLERRVAERTESLRQAQEQLHQAQKMEAIGQLTGGVAHDFNNLLTVILGNLDTLWRHIPSEDGRLRRAIEHSTASAQRAATLTHQLLAFSRRQPLNPKPTDINRLVTTMSDLLARTLGEKISIETVLGAGLWRVEVDAHQLESALLNLAVNARDAMPDGGKLTIETANAHLDDIYASGYAEITPGQYVAICLSDTGAGMPATVLEKAFEPFFTTKPIGQGTGLGLSQVYGFVKQSGGHIKLYSEERQGTTVKIYLPRLLRDTPELLAAMPSSTPRGKPEECILVVEDDEDVRAYSTESLRELGYSVFEASGAEEALSILERGDRIDLLFTDVGLPGLDGRKLADLALHSRPALRVVFTSGYARNAIVHHGRLEQGVNLLTKPFTRAQLAVRIRDALNLKGSKGSSGAPAARLALVVEDEVLIQMDVTATLQDFGFTVLKAGTAQEAIEAANTVRHIAFAFVDVGLPDRSGLTVARELRARQSDTCIVIASGYGTDVRKIFGEDPAVLSLAKPFDRQDIRTALCALGLDVSEPTQTAPSP